VGIMEKEERGKEVKGKKKTQEKSLQWVNEKRIKTKERETG